MFALPALAAAFNVAVSTEDAVVGGIVARVNGAWPSFQRRNHRAIPEGCESAEGGDEIALSLPLIFRPEFAVVHWARPRAPRAVPTCSRMWCDMIQHIKTSGDRWSPRSRPVHHPPIWTPRRPRQQAREGQL